MTIRAELLVAASAALLAAAPAQAEGDAVRGEQQFMQCRACHVAEAGKPDAMGPNLYGVFGKRAATNRPKFAYSPALKASGITWDEASLDSWITDPAKMVPGSAMHFIGVPRKPTRDNIVAYLKSLGK